MEDICQAKKAVSGAKKQAGVSSSLKAAQNAPAAAQKASQKQQQKQQKKQKGKQPETAEEVHAMIKKLQATMAANDQAKEQRKLLKSDDRDKGNEAVRATNWQAALRHYNAAIAADPSDVRSYSNRALVYSKLKGRSAKVVEDATQVRVGSR
jgi:tetratricopeptide (TPR) repeat protein